MRKQLRIKKIFLNQIRKGEKKFEYRNFNNFYLRMFKNGAEIKELKFHYQNPDDYLIIKVKKIEIVKNYLNSEFVNTPRMYRLELGEIIEDNKGDIKK